MWVPRALLKAKALDGDMLKLMRDEIKWRAIIKRQLEKVERLKQRDKLLKIQAEKEILVTHSLDHSLTHSLTHSLNHSRRRPSKTGKEKRI
jgi:hypothetical protein